MYVNIIGTIFTLAFLPNVGVSHIYTAINGMSRPITFLRRSILLWVSIWAYQLTLQREAIAKTAATFFLSLDKFKNGIVLRPKDAHRLNSLR
ncbi:hypothetical protein AAKU64_002824 [Undibacterium sp. GrIS 1.8]